MKRLLFLPLIFIFFLNSYAFGQEISDPIRACKLYVTMGDYQKAIMVGEKSISLYPENIKLRACLGEAYFKAGQFDLALQNFKKVESYIANSGNLEDLMNIYSWLGSAYFMKKDLNNALFYSNKSLNLAKMLGDKIGERMALKDIADIFSEKGDFNKALSYYEESLKLANNEFNRATNQYDMLKIGLHIATTYNNIAFIYLKKKENNKAIDYFKKAIKICEQSGNYYNIVEFMLNLGNTYREIKDFDNAYFYLQEGLKNIQKSGDKFLEATAYKYFGYYFRDKGDKIIAKDYLNRAYELFKSISAEAEVQAVLQDISALDTPVDKKKQKSKKK